MLEELPLGKAHLMTFQLMPIGPRNPLRQLSTQPPAGKTNVKRIMYIERKDGKPDCQGRIGWVELSRTARSYVYNGKRRSRNPSLDSNTMKTARIKTGAFP